MDTKISEIRQVVYYNYYELACLKKFMYRTQQKCRKINSLSFDDVNIFLDRYMVVRLACLFFFSFCVIFCRSLLVYVIATGFERLYMSYN